MFASGKRIIRSCKFIALHDPPLCFINPPDVNEIGGFFRGNIAIGQDCKEVTMYSAYNSMMSAHQECATKRIPVRPSTWEEIHGLRKPGQTFDDVIREMVKKEKLNRLSEDTDRICQRDRFVEYPV
jgi:hypothetical protein